MRRRHLIPAAIAAMALVPAANAHPLPTAPGCPIFPADNQWNERVDHLPVASHSSSLMKRMAIPHLHPDFGSIYGIPYNVVTSSTPMVHVSFDYADESDPGPYPIPASPLQEDGSDGHILIVDSSTCHLYELFAASESNGHWSAGSGAIWDLNSNALRPPGWTSADAAGLPIFPGLARYDEIHGGNIDHALRFTLSRTQQAYLFPARHYASNITDPAVAPMGLRLRLKSSYDISHFSAPSRVVLEALKRYGMIVADNGSPGYVTGAPDSRLSDDALHDLNRVPGSAFEVVDTSSLTGTPLATVHHPRTTVSGRRVRIVLFLTRDARLRIQVIVRHRVVATHFKQARQGLVVLRLRAVRGARYRVRPG
jgi:hypothetical protein